jgi:hypothetical protein
MRGGDDDLFGVIRKGGSSLDPAFFTIVVFFSDMITDSHGPDSFGRVSAAPSARRADGEVDTGRSMCKAFGLSGGESRGFFAYIVLISQAPKEAKTALDLPGQVFLEGLKRSATVEIQ